MQLYAADIYVITKKQVAFTTISCKKCLKTFHNVINFDTIFNIVMYFGHFYFATISVEMYICFCNVLARAKMTAVIQNGADKGSRACSV